jgi:Thaumatin family
MSHMTASSTGTFICQYGMMTTTALSVAVMLLVGCASWGGDSVSSADAVVAAGGSGQGQGKAEDPSVKRFGQSRTGTPDCLANLPTPTPRSPAHRVIQLVNCSDQTLLGAANAAKQPGQPLTSVFPREQTWEMKPAGSPNLGNVLTIDIPPQWENTKCAPGAKSCDAVGPRFWARTGCRYDIPSDRAQCETGGCGGKYDCSKAQLGASVGTTIAEWTFYEPVKAPLDAPTLFYNKDSPDISAVDGVNLTIDIQPLNSSPHDPFDALGGHDIQWLAEQYPLSKSGQDLRAPGQCLDTFRLKRSDLTSGTRAFVIVDNDGQPLGGDSTVACFSNCARYAYPAPPPITCDDSDRNSQCYLWKAFCLGDPSQYGPARGKCTQNRDCPVGGACWDLRDATSPLDHTCQGRAFIKNATCDPSVCTYPYGYVDPVKNITFYSTQPPFGQCTDVIADPNKCIGDDTLHAVLPKAYTWPNDPQVYGGDATAYRIIFAPGGTPVPITPAGDIPICSELPTIYGYASQYGGAKSASKPCDVPVNQGGAVFGVAFPGATAQNPWACDVGAGSGDNGVICRWKADTRHPRE